MRIDPPWMVLNPDQGSGIPRDALSLLFSTRLYRFFVGEELHQPVAWFVYCFRLRAFWLIPSARVPEFEI
jgi:hypothetical protein